MTSSFISLGSGQILPWDVHPSLSLIHQLKLFNFPVPNGLVFLNPPHDQLKPESELVQELLEEIKKRELSSSLAITRFNSGTVPSSETIICDVENFISLFLELTRYPVENSRIDYVVMEHFVGNARGSAHSKKGFIDDWIDFQLGTEKPWMPPQNIPIEKISLGESKIAGDFRGRVQDLLRAIRRALGEDDWTISWVDDGESVYLTSISTLSSFKEPNTLFIPLVFIGSDPEKLSPLEGDLAVECSNKLSQYFNHWAFELNPARDWILWRDNHLQYNYFFLTDFVRSFGISTRNLNSFLSFNQVSVVPFNLFRFWRSLPRLLRLIHDLSLGPGLALRTAKKLNHFKTEAEKSFADIFHEWQSIFISSQHSAYRLGLLKLLITYFPAWIASKYQMRIKKSNQELEQAYLKAKAEVEVAIRTKALGWYARGILANEDEIWGLTKKRILELEKEGISIAP